MEIQPPEKPIHTVKDFLLQLMTIAIGILIALSLEGALEWSHHRTLVREAKENPRQEILANNEAALQFIGDLLAHRAKGHRALEFQSYIVAPADTSWNTAQAAGAVTYMSYQDVQKHAGVYGLQRKRDVFQDRLAASLFGGGAVGRSGQGSALSGRACRPSSRWKIWRTRLKASTIKALR
jgi:hypothetical protein